MFEINSYLLNKIGWKTYKNGWMMVVDHENSSGSILKNARSLFADDDLVHFYFDKQSEKKCYVIKELSEKEKQKSKNLYKFIIVDYDLESPIFEVIEFNSNIELFRMIIEYELGEEDYIRHFKVIKVLKTK